MPELSQALAFFVFSVDGHRVAIAAEHVSEIVHLPATFEAPGQPSILRGFFNLRGTLIPVVDLRRLFGLGAERHVDLYSVVAVIRSAEGPLGLLADDAEGLLPADPAAVLPLRSQQSFNGCALGEIDDPDGPVTLLGCDRIVLEQERQCISELAAKVTERLAELEHESGHRPH